MSELIPSPDESSSSTISKTDLQPRKRDDDPSILRKFANFVRQNIGLKPLYLVERFGVAKVESQEADVRIKILEAQQGYELLQAQIRTMVLEADGKRDLAQAEADAIRAKTKSVEASTRLKEEAARLITMRGQTPEQAVENLKLLVDKVRSLGGDVEMPPIDGEVVDPADEADE